MDKLNDLISMSKVNELLGRKEDKKIGKKVLWALAIIGAVAAVAAIAYGVYKFLQPDYMDDFDDDFDDFDDDLYDEEPVAAAEAPVE